MLLAILGFTRVQYKLLAGPETAESLDDDPHFLDLCDSLRALGFEPAAVRREQGWFYLWFWLRTSLPQAVFARPGRDCFAVLYRLYRGDPWRLSLATILTRVLHFLSTPQVLYAVSANRTASCGKRALQAAPSQPPEMGGNANSATRFKTTACVHWPLINE